MNGLALANPAVQPFPLGIREMDVARLCGRQLGRRIGDDADASMFGFEPPKHERVERDMLAEQGRDRIGQFA